MPLKRRYRRKNVRRYRRKPKTMGGKKFRKSVKTIVRRELAKNVEDKYLYITNEDPSLVALIQGGATDASGVLSGYWSGPPIQGVDIGLGDGLNDRIGSVIMCRKFIMDFRFRTQGTNCLLFPTTYTMYLVRYKATYPEQSFDATQVFAPDFSIASANSDMFNCDWLTPMSLRNPDFMKQYRVLKKMTFTVKPETTAAQESRVIFKRLIYTPKGGAERVSFDTSTGQFLNQSYRVLIFASNGCSGAAPTGTAIPVLADTTQNSGLTFNHTTKYIFRDP